MNRNPKRILITGVTKGLGLALVEEFIARGHKIVGCGRSENKIAGLKRRYNPEHRFEIIDVSDYSRVKVWANSLIQTGIIPDLLINNAAIINQRANLWEISEKEFSDVIDINIKGTANIIRAFAPAMLGNGSGIIVNISSTWGRTTSPQVVPYCTSKWAIEGLSKSLAQEVAGRLTIVSLNPGVINTEMLQTCLPSIADSCPSPEEWAAQAAPLLLNLKSSDNGKSLNV